MTEASKKDQLYQLIRAHPFISQQELADRLGLSRSAVAGHIAGLIREKRLLGRAYVFPNSRPVLCIGGANVDRKLRTLDRLRMHTSNPVSQHESFGGVARNIAENLARLGAPTALLTAVGDDASGRAMLAHAEASGIDPRGSLQVAGAATGSYTAVLDAGGEMMLALAHMALCDALTPEFLVSRQAQRAAAALTVADLNLPQDSVRLLLDDARRGHAPLVLVAVSQPKMTRLPADLTGLRLLILNLGELEARAGAKLSTAAKIAKACRALQHDGVRDVIVTRGEDGALYTTPDGVAELPAPAVAVTDVTGAGDAFAAAACWSLYHDDHDLALACRRGLTLAALTAQSPATVCPELTPASLDTLLA
ncbi:MAG TPA: PfkB family carbohydrate kinase [Paucimonas sp.]|nr:PfkB family carbohydrate kinase [Paucimonas sp.]